jgi:hypothetical protein
LRVQRAAPPPIDRVRRRVARRKAVRGAVAVGAPLAGIAVVGVLVVGQGDGGVRDRGTDVAGGAPLVGLDAVADGPGGPRPLADGVALGPDDRVVFFVRTSADGEATIREIGRSSVVVYPPTGTWSVRAGDNVPGGGSPLAWRTDQGAGTVQYVVEVCASGGACATDAMTVRWTGP